ncbi:hypothetical protein [Cellvibrio sp. QJXJ]|nr:hypothetical protein [Cellvibrio sp. QJXJ]UUA73562.1 hypothetical protein NNX04_03725 [Cellvibrio sp. QJXJ]
MPEYIVTLASTLIGGGAVWGAIRTEIKFLWRDVGELKKQVAELKKAA